jgi:CheY-like chemotaxis protein
MNRNIIALVDDLFFASKIRAVAEAVGVTVRFARSNEQALHAAEASKPDLIIVDLNSQSADAIAFASEAKADEALRPVPLLGFFSHVQVELQQAAQAAGYDQLLPRSAFTQRLPQILGGDA